MLFAFFVCSVMVKTIIITSNNNAIKHFPNANTAWLRESGNTYSEMNKLDLFECNENQHVIRVHRATDTNVLKSLLFWWTCEYRDGEDGADEWIHMNKTLTRASNSIMNENCINFHEHTALHVHILLHWLIAVWEKLIFSATSVS